jgi:hypothetical protein
MLIAHAATFPRRTSIRTGTFPLPLAHAAIFLAAVFLISGIFAPRLQAQYCGLVNAPPEALRNQPLPNGALAGISGAMGREENKYQAAPLGDGFQMESSALRADFTPVRVDFYAQGERWSTRLESYGRGDSVANLPPVAPTGNGNRVEYRRGSFTEWYLNGPMGLEQGFTLTRRADGAASEPLTLAFALSGDLRGTLDTSGRNFQLTRRGVPFLRYGGLSVTDATGRELNAWMELSGDLLRIKVADAGAQYPLTIDPFVQIADLTVCDGGFFDKVGTSSSITGDGKTIVVGASDSAIHTSSCGYLGCLVGAAYVFAGPRSSVVGNTIDGNAAIAKLMASDFTPSGFFGYSVAVSDDASTIVVGSPGATGPIGIQGALYVFAKPANGWTRGPRSVLNETAKLTASDARAADGLGWSVAISADGSTIVSGAFAATGVNIGQGAGYVFNRGPNGWVSTTQKAKLTTSGATSGNGLGYSVAISSNAETIAIGAPGPATTSGAIYIYIEGNAILVNRGREKVRPVIPPNILPRAWSNMTETAKLTASDGIPNDRLGLAVAMNPGGATVVGGADATVGQNSEQGAAYVFTKPATGFWVTAAGGAKLTASDGALQDGLGLALGVNSDGSVVAAGAPFANSASGNEAQGAVYVFQKPTAGWTSTTQTSKLVTASGQTGDAFGSSVAMDTGDTIIGGAPGIGSGSLYVFKGGVSAPPETLSATSLTFNGAVNTRTTSQTVTFTNQSDAPLQLTGVSVTGKCETAVACVFPFTSTKNCVAASPLAPGAHCSESVTFVPPRPGSYDASLAFTFDSGASTSVQTVQLHGTTAASIQLPKQRQR